MKIYSRGAFGAGLFCLLICVGFLSVTYNIAQLQDPVPEYEQYVYAEKDGYAKIEFMYSESVTGNEKTIVIYQEDTEQYIELRFFRAPENGFYYRYFVAYNNGSVVSPEQSFMPYAENRTLVDFGDVYLSISQNYTRMVESIEQRLLEVDEQLFSGVAAIFAGLFMLVCFAESLSKPDYRRGGRW